MTKAKNRKILLLPGDGIGPEVVREVQKIIEALLFASPIPLTQAKVNNVFGPETPNLKKIVKALNDQYDKETNSKRICLSTR